MCTVDKMNCCTVVLAVFIALQLSFTGVKAVDGDTGATCKAGDVCTLTTDTCETNGTAKTCRAKVGTTCNATANCVANAECPASGDNKTCTCSTGYLALKDNSACRKKLNETCPANSAECGLNAECPASLKCSCVANFTADPIGRCAAKVGTTCTNTTACVADSECPATGDSKAVCTCKTGYTALSDNTGCRANVGTTCNATANCVANAECPASRDNKTCTCSTEYLALKDNSACRKKLNETCPANSAECGLNAECPASLKCSCVANFTADPIGRCAAKVGTTCTNTTACVADSDCPATGDSKVCTCKTGYTALPDNTGCRANVGTACTATTNCVTNAACGDTKTCTCNTGYVALKGNSACRLKVNGTCTANGTDCGANAECPTSLKCACMANFVADPIGRCGKLATATCTNDSECVSDATCNGTPQICTCKDGYTASANKFCTEKTNTTGSAGLCASFLMIMAAVVMSLLL